MVREIKNGGGKSKGRKVLIEEEERSSVVPRDMIMSKKANNWTKNTISLPVLTHNLFLSPPRAWQRVGGWGVRTQSFIKCHSTFKEAV